VPRPALEQLFAPATTPAARHVVDIPTLIALKQTQRAKDYAVIAELAARLPPEREIEVTTDPDRILALATAFGCQSSRPAVRAARQAPVERRAVVLALAEEIDALPQADRRRVAAYETAAQLFLQTSRAADVSTLPLRLAHARMVEMAERLLPRTVDWENARADAQ
jgi:predicted RNA-binding Zn ribbon-like protein